MRARFFILLAFSPSLAHALILQESDINVHAEHDGDTIHVTVEMKVAVKPRRAWDVMTDFERMPGFVPHLSSSKIVARAGNRLKVAQKGEYSLGLWSFPYESLRDVTLFPYSKVTSHSSSGSVKSMDSVTYFVAEGQQTRVNYNVTLMPNFSIPPLIGANLISGEIREQFQGMRDEMLRREQLAKQLNPSMATGRNRLQRRA
jgi:uncharacterized membrane protein